MNDPNVGYLARRGAIKASTDHLRNVASLNADALILGELMLRYLQQSKRKVDAADLSLRTLHDHLSEIPKFVEFLKPQTPLDALRAEHFSAYMIHLLEQRKLGRHARRRVRAYVNTFLNFGVKNGWMTRPATGSDWVVPATDPESMRVARMRSGKKDASNRIFTGAEIDKLLAMATPAWRAIILIAVNCGLGPADIGRLRWKHLSLQTGRLDFPRGKTGVTRTGYLWKRTRQALIRNSQLKHSRIAIAREGDEAFVFLSHRGEPMYGEQVKSALIAVDGKQQRKLVGVRFRDPVPRTFGRLVRRAELVGLSFYRLRHT